MGSLTAPGPVLQMQITNDADVSFHKLKIHFHVLHGFCTFMHRLQGLDVTGFFISVMF